ncbi:MAG: polymerase [Rhodoferax sp.]|uniref:O-antigen ligase family protein n=1 Tax=Rhodoferax sp. TaxID=50421 RepID=UPI001839BC03|nr:O-antigen ligase family protein [Rhodoferax sp.]NMM14079.1 polymerase [Rhodoferax sp.]
MLEYLFPAGFFIAAFLGAWVVILVSVGSLQMARRFPDGLLHYYFYAVLFSNCLAIFLSTRSFAEAGETIQEGLTTNPLAAWAIRLTSLFALLASADLITRYLGPSRRIGGIRAFLAIVFGFFWVTNIVVPALFSPHTMPFQLNWFYSLVLGMGMIFMVASGATLSIRHCRNAIFLFCAASLLLIPIRPDLVMQSDYTQGYLPGIPRFAGLAPHAIVMGMNAALGLWCLMAYPMASRTLNRLCWLIGLSALFLAQSKTVWFSFLVSLPVMLYCQHGLPSWQSLTASRHRSLFALLGSLTLLGITGVTAILLFGNVGTRLEHFLGSSEGAQVMSLTGRDQIWAVALSEWDRSPIVGYGLPLFGLEHQAQIGMKFATSGHNQIIDSLGRAGTVGAAGTLLYALTLLWLGLRFGRSSRGLSAALAISIVIRMISEVPITLGNIGIDSLPYYLLLAVIAAHLGKPDSRGATTHA